MNDSRRCAALVYQTECKNSLPPHSHARTSALDATALLPPLMMMIIIINLLFEFPPCMQRQCIYEIPPQSLPNSEYIYILLLINDQMKFVQLFNWITFRLSDRQWCTTQWSRKPQIESISQFAFKLTTRNRRCATVWWENCRMEKWAAN